ncbi:hypothetical protein PUN28_008283 [Cardiocondyla obscurior]|uniref:Uncharacterized protein n=1 Tax=Cardiocondyla obscurior TaxID=286306 RepID=A0AAW2G1R9_9HYME
MASQSGIPMNGPPSKRARTESQMKLTGTAKDQGKNDNPLQILESNRFPKGVYMTTPLCEVPWNRPFWYINESEFNILPNGSSISSCGIKICQRNVRVAFPTNSTASNLATLNQNKNIIYSIGLNKNVDCLPVEYSSFDDSQPMVPTGIKR